MPKLALVERGIRRAKSFESSERVRLPITPSILRQMKALWSKPAHDYDIVMLWAACCTAFFGFFRMGELTTPTTTGLKEGHGVLVGDIAIDNPSMVIHLSHLKTDQFGNGVDIYLRKMGQDLCPISALGELDLGRERLCMSSLSPMLSLGGRISCTIPLDNLAQHALLLYNL